MNKEFINKGNISRLGFGGWQLGSDETWGNVPFKESIELVRKAVEEGINFFDTAPGYSSGRSEEIIGIALHDIRDKVYINSKIGHKADGTSDFSIDGIEKSIKDSLSRLQTTYLDSALLHNPGMEVLQRKTNHFKELKRLKNTGLIHAYGVSIDSYDELKTVLDNTDVQVIELLFNVFFQSTLPLFEKIKEKQITLIIKVPLDSGWLTGKYNANSSFTGVRARWDENVIIRRSKLVDELTKITNDRDLTKYALGFIWSFDAVTTIIPGIKSLSQLQAHIENQKFVFPTMMKDKFIKFYNTNIKDKPLPW